MSAPNAMHDDQITPVEVPHAPAWQAYGAALLPLALLGVLPVWACLLLCLLFGLGVRSVLWHEGRLLISFLIVGAAIVGHLLGLGGLSVALNSGGLGNLLVLYLAGLLGVGGLSWGASLLEEGRRRGLFFVLAAGLVSPQPLLLLALAGGALMRPGLDDRRPGWLGREGAGWTGKNAAWLALPVALALALAVALPRPAPLWNTSSPPPVQAQAPAEVPPAEPSARPSTLAPLQPPAPRPRLITEDVIPAPPGELVLVAGILVLFALFLLLRVIPAQRGRPATLVEWLMGAGLVLTLVLLVALAFGGAPGQEAGTLPPAQAEALAPIEPDTREATPEERCLTSFLNLVLWAALLFYLAVFALLVHTALSLRGASRRDAQAALPTTPDAPDAAALHRVRVAYRNTETALTDAGRGRAAHETPQGYAARLAADLPTLAAPLNLLARVYAPVRYGGSVSLTDADAAEAAEGTIRAELPTLPPVASSDAAE
ncbi:DUF4129 domain-containing protein [Deinococcus puniceus]|uniref:Protein-glutamine gamma-glutamyltransferase-like C-terminal domain-containing protein n=1 Tax=Deinococcus puniceus TaxID=1182568 RepID=A0A172T9J5_9DEIO|nr:DUF4129 domain-containing protein [Deinococcus puniceus]ANE43671.1 hypothetical protein SU48_07710 [Deinococcus puniceus]